MRADSQKSLDLLKKMLGSSEYKERVRVRKAWTQPATATTGFVRYNLEIPSKKLYPIITPFRNLINRNNVDGGNAINWRGLTGINTGNSSPGVSEGNRNEFIAHTTADYTKKFAGLGHEDYVTFEAGYSGRGFEDVRQLSMETALQALMISEERVILGGNASLALGTPALPAGVAAVGGTMSARTVRARVVALSHEGLRFAGTSGPVITTLNRTNADGSVDVINGGSSIRSAESLDVVVAAGGDKKVTWTWTAVRGAAGYALFSGLAGATKLIAITTVNTYVQLADEAGGAQDTSTITVDNSKNALEFDGIMTFIMDPAGNGYWKSLDGAFLTSNSDGSVKEIDAALRDRWDNYRLTIEEIWVSAQELVNLTNKVTAGGTATAFRITLPNNFNDMSSITAGTIVGQYMSKFNMEGGRSIPIRLHPDIPAGTLIGLSYSLPYPVNNVPSVWRMAVRQEYYGQDWPVTKRRYEYGTYVDETLQCYFPASCIIISNIGNG